MKEATVISKAVEEQRPAFELYTNAFMDLRQTLMNLSYHWDEGRDTFLVQDKESIEHLLLIRVRTLSTAC